MRGAHIPWFPDHAQKKGGYGSQFSVTVNAMLTQAGSFNDQQHSIGPTLFFNPGGANGEDDNGNGMGNHIQVAGPAKPEFSLNVGIQFGLTDLTSDSALKFQGALEF